MADVQRPGGGSPGAAVICDADEIADEDSAATGKGQAANIWTAYETASPLSWLDSYAADHPLEALRHFADWLSDFRLEACALTEPAAALVYADHRLTPEQRAACQREAARLGALRFFPDDHAPERRKAIAQTEGRS